MSKETITIAYQTGIAYAPLIIMEKNGMIENHYDGELEINWQILNGGNAINEGIISGDIDIGAMGVAPVIVGIKAGIPYKICSGISSQPYDVMTNIEGIARLSDITKDIKISCVGLNSMPHILLAMASKHELGDSHALDENLVFMSNTDGMTALISGAVDCQMCISPFNFMEAKYENIHKIDVSNDVWPTGDTFIVAVSSSALHDDKPELYNAFCEALKEAVEYMETNQDETISILQNEYDASAEDIKEWLNDEKSGYDVNVKGIGKLGAFMSEEGF